MIRRNIYFGALLICIFLFTTTSFAKKNIMIMFDGNEMESTDVQVVSNRILVPVRVILEKMGITFEWIEKTRTVIARKEGTSICLVIDSINAYINDKRVIKEVLGEGK